MKSLHRFVDLDKLILNLYIFSRFDKIFETYIWQIQKTNSRKIIFFSGQTHQILLKNISIPNILFSKNWVLCMSSNELSISVEHIDVLNIHLFLNYIILK